MATRGINYEYNEKSPAYESVRLHTDDELKVFDSGDFVKDWYDCTKHIIMDIGDSEYVCNSSDVDHFIMDGAPYDSAWLVTSDGTSELSYTYQEGCLEFFVKEGTQPTWLELRALCGDPKKGNSESH
jgi:hypothetical protein